LELHFINKQYAYTQVIGIYEILCDDFEAAKEKFNRVFRWHDEAGTPGMFKRKPKT